MPTGNEPCRPLWADIDLTALAHNLALVRRLAGRRRLIASVKANAYGHGVVTIARELARLGVDILWTGSSDEALAIRAAGIDARILLFGGYLPGDIPVLLRHGLTPTIYDRAGAQAVSAAAAGPTPVYLKVDSGLGRLGVPVADAGELVAEIAALPRVVIEGIYTHLPFGDAAGRDEARMQAETFASLLRRLAAQGIDPPVTQVWASSGLLAQLPDACNAVCVGHLLYGLSPVSREVASAGELRPVMRAIKTRLIHVVHRSAGAAQAGAYGLRNARVTGVVPLGLGDGMRNAVAGQSMSMLVRGRRAPVLGVSLEHTTLDLTGIESAQVGDEAILVGRSDGLANSFRDLARWFGCGELEALMTFSGRLQTLQIDPQIGIECRR
ncbi:MAG: alanine racemase [Dongiaceae bacterium]